jgi:hypothetical protein
MEIVNLQASEVTRLEDAFFGGAFAKLRNANKSFVMSVRPHATTWLPLEGFWVKLDISAFFENLYRISHVLLKSDKNNGHFTCRPIYIFDNISLSSS